MTLSFIRSLFLVVSGAVGYYIGTLLELEYAKSSVSIMAMPLYCTMIGLLCGLSIIFLEQRLKRVSVRGLSSIVFGLVLGILMAKMIVKIMTLIPMSDFIASISELVITIIFSYLEKFNVKIL